ncbi:alpha/beta hydrolase [Elusimicrobiota bacterium]
MLNKLWLVARLPLLVAAGIYVFILLYFSISQARFIYFPYSIIEATPADIGLYYEDIAFKTEDNIELNGWFVPAEKAKAVLLFCHGNAGNISHRLESIKIFNEIGLSVFIFDYRGYGKSEGKPAEAGTYIDAEAAWRYLKEVKGVKQENIIIFGRSLGGAIGAYLAKEHKPKALVVESSYTSINDIASDLYPLIPMNIISRFGYNTSEYIGEVKCPVLVVHSSDDEIIPFRHGRQLFEDAEEPKRFLEISGSHNEGFIMSIGMYTEGLKSFIYSNE